MSVRAVVPLELMQAGESGQVVEVGGEANLVHRLEEMGIRTGVALRVVRGGCPCIVHVGGQRLSLRGAGQVTVLVALDSQYR